MHRLPSAHPLIERWLLQALIAGASFSLLVPFAQAHTMSFGWLPLWLIGGGVHYFFRYPKEKKYRIALGVYIAISVIDGAYLFFPFWAMLLFMLADGMLGVTSYNIRISSTQNYLPDEIRGRFNGLFQMLTILGTISGQLIAGAIGDLFDIRWVVVASMTLTVLAVFVIIVANGAHVKKIYNVNV